LRSFTASEPSAKKTNFSVFFATFWKEIASSFPTSDDFSTIPEQGTMRRLVKLFHLWVVAIGSHPQAVGLLRAVENRKYSAIPHGISLVFGICEGENFTFSATQNDTFL
jgi:hypothetical protein